MGAEYKTMARKIVEVLYSYGMSDNAIGIAIGRRQETINRIRHGLLSGVRCEDDLRSLYRLSKIGRQ